MDQGKRPGGLTTLAVVNFVVAGLSLLSIVNLVFLLVLVTTGAADNPEMKEVKDLVEQMGRGWIIALIGIYAVTVALLILSGIGYLLLKPILGRWIGNGYALVSIASSLGVALLMPDMPRGGFNMGTIVGLVYPILTVFLLNTTFKGDFGR